MNASRMRRCSGEKTVVAACDGTRCGAAWIAVIGMSVAPAITVRLDMRGSDGFMVYLLGMLRYLRLVYTEPCAEGSCQIYVGVQSRFLMESLCLLWDFLRPLFLLSNWLKDRQSHHERLDSTFSHSNA